MSIFFSLFSSALGAVFFGLLITAFLMVLLYFLMQCASKGTVKSLAFYITGPILFLILWFNSSIFCAAWQLKNAVDGIKIWISQHLFGYDGIVDIEISQAVWEAIEKHYPLAKSFFGLADFTGCSYDQLPALIADTMNSELNSLMWRSVFWILGTIACAVIVIMIFDKGRGSDYYGDSRRGRSTSRYDSGYESRYSRNRRDSQYSGRTRRAFRD